MDYTVVNKETKEHSYLEKIEIAFISYKRLGSVLRLEYELSGNRKLVSFSLIALLAIFNQM